MNLMSYCRDRLFEWVMTCAMLGLAFEIALWPQVIGSSSFRLILSIISAENMGLFFGLFGMLRIVALVANGSWPTHGPRMRAFGAGAAALMWGQMCIALLILLPHKNGVPSPGIPIYFALTIGEIVSAYRAISDAARPAVA